MDKSLKITIVLCSIFLLVVLAFGGYIVYYVNQPYQAPVSAQADVSKWDIEDYTESIFLLGASWGYAEAVIKNRAGRSLPMTKEEIDLFTEKAKAYWWGRGK